MDGMVMASNAKSARPNIIKRFTGYIGDVRSEMKRVVWPQRDEVMNSSMVVITTLVIFTLMIGLADQLVIQIVRLIGNLGGG